MIDARRWRSRLLFSVCLFAAFLPPLADGESRTLLSEARGAQKPAWFSPAAAKELRGKMSRFDPQLLESISAALAQANGRAVFALDLFDDATFTVAANKVESFGRSRRYVIHGTLTDERGSAKGTALFSVVDGVLQAEVLTDDGRKYAIQHVTGDLCRVSELDTEGDFGECMAERSVAATSDSRLPAADSAAIAAQAAPAAAETEPAIVDIMIVYTPALQAKLGGAQAVEARAQLAISAANTMFEISEIKARVRLAHVAKVNYTEDPDMSVDLWRLADPTDGYMDEVAALREQYAADVVHLFGSFGDFRRGQATGYPSDYHAVVISGDTGLFVHELGHNFGCQHDRNAAGLGGSSYAFGHVFDAAEDGRRYGCVMSYTGSAGAQQLPRFSNPNISYKGTPTGVAKGRPDSADNARMVDLTAPMLAAFRSPDGWSNRVPVFATPPRLGFAMTTPGATSGRENIRLAFAGASRGRPLRVTDFRVNGDAEAFLIEVWNPTTGQFIAPPDFTIPENGLTLFVRFRPAREGTAQAAISFNIDDPAYRYHPPEIRLVGNASAPHLKNISTRVRVGAGDDALIGGFIVGGDAPRDVIVRAVGPSLATQGVAGALVDPTIELYRGAELLAQNDEWVDGPAREAIKWTGVAPAKDLESAVRRQLEPGSYTAVVRGVGGATGVALVEAYDLDIDGGTQLLNLSTRGHVRAGDDTMIGGFILGGATASRILVRALGPSLASAGVANALDDPAVEIFNGQGTAIASNDSWRSDNEAAIEETGVAPSDDREAATLLALQPGAYTAVVRGTGGASGVGLVEVYNLGPQ